MPNLFHKRASTAATVFTAVVTAAASGAYAQPVPKPEPIVVGAPKSAAAIAADKAAAKAPTILHGESIAVAAPRKAGAAASNRNSAALPVGLAVVWRADGHAVERAFAWSIDTYSADGKLVGIGDWSGIRVLRASDGRLLRHVPADSVRDTAYSLAVSSNGEIAVGRVGNVELYPAAASAPPRRLQCPGICGPVGAVAFSPDSVVLAYQAAMGKLERQQGLGGVNVVATRSGNVVAQLDALTARAELVFSADGRTLRAASANQLDDGETFGVRMWSTADWRVRQTVLGGKKIARSLSRLDGTPLAAAIERDGNLEVRDVADDKLLWAVPLVPPSLDGNASTAVSLDLVEIAPNGKFVLSYETPVRDGLQIDMTGTVVIRRAERGEVIAMYDVAGVVDIAIAPDSETFMYSTAAGQPYTVLARVPIE